jgi:hypothetical protein
MNPLAFLLYVASVVCEILGLWLAYRDLKARVMKIRNFRPPGPLPPTNWNNPDPPWPSFVLNAEWLLPKFNGERT